MKTAVIGGGSWGMTMALHLHNLGHQVHVWEYDANRVKAIRETGFNDLLPELPIPKEIVVSNAMSEILQEPELIVTAVPSHVMRAAMKLLNGIPVKSRPLIVNISKGIENDTLLRMSEVIAESLSWEFEDIVALYGPSHAEEVSRGVPTLIVAASPNLEIAKKVQEIFMSPRLRIYTSTDRVGVELGGSLKNVVAIAAGMIDGVGFGDNTKAALVVRGSFEIMRAGLALGADAKTFSGLSGIGDLIVTAMSRHSRNRYVGEELGKGRKLNAILSGMKMVAEGVHTAKSAHQLSLKTGIEMPIANAVYRILFEDCDPLEEVDRLMNRDPREEYHSVDMKGNEV
jgi:glycerol-3-phosphate dehydrogenase (NAD(P)+)